jgi:hypothetical protein
MTVLLRRVVPTVPGVSGGSVVTWRGHYLAARPLVHVDIPSLLGGSRARHTILARVLTVARDSWSCMTLEILYTLPRVGT